MTRYRVLLVDRPVGWQPATPDDVPPEPGPPGEMLCETETPRLSYLQAAAIVHGLNEQAMRHAGTMWYVVIAVENEPVSHTVS